MGLAAPAALAAPRAAVAQWRRRAPRSPAPASFTREAVPTLCQRRAGRRRVGGIAPFALWSCEAALADRAHRYGAPAALGAGGSSLLCGKDAASVRPSTTTSCDRMLSQPAATCAVAGHMHPLDRSIRLQLDPGAARCLAWGEGTEDETCLGILQVTRR